MKTKYEQDEVTWDTLGRSMLESSSSGENKNLNLHEKLKYGLQAYWIEDIYVYELDTILTIYSKRISWKFLI